MTHAKGPGAGPRNASFVKGFGAYWDNEPCDPSNNEDWVAGWQYARKNRTKGKDFLMSTNDDSGRPKMTCETCKFFEPIDTGAAGECRESGPIGVVNDEGNGKVVEGWWPTVLKQNWCGKRKSRET